MPDEDRRYLILGEDGRHVLLGRAQPGACDIQATTAAMELANLRGWVVRASGTFHTRAKPVLQEVAPINRPMVPFAMAVKAAGGKVGEVGGAAVASGNLL